MNKYKIIINKNIINNFYKNFKSKKYLKFNTNDLNLKGKNLRKLQKNFETLPIDKYNSDFLKEKYNLKFAAPTRFRKFANYNIDIEGNEASIEILDQLTFLQNVNDFRNSPRKFKPVDKHIRESNYILSLVGQFCFLTNKINPKKKKFNVSFHQVRQLCYPGVIAENSPEGIHKDGSDYIISAIVLNRKNITGGESIIYNDDKETVIFKETLDCCEAIFQDDVNLWHYVTPINCIDDNFLGIRDIIGFDIKFLD